MTNEQLRLGQNQRKLELEVFSSVFGLPNGKDLSPGYFFSVFRKFPLDRPKRFRPAYAAWLQGKVEETSFRVPNERIASVNSILL